MRVRYLISVLAIALLVCCPSAIPAQGSTTAATDQRVTGEVADEVDHWRGSSLGIRLESESEKIMVTKIHDHAVELSPFQEGDELVSLADIALAEKKLSDIGDLLSRTLPGSTLLATVVRDNKTHTLELATLRQQLVDIAPIHRRLSSNRIIKKHLTDTERPEFFDDFSDRMIAAVRSSQSPRESYEAINRIIDEIGVSHTAIVPASSYSQLIRGTGGDVGLTLRRYEINGRKGYFVIDIKPGTAGYDCGIQLGDEVININGLEIEKSKRLILSGEEDRYNVFALQADEDQEMRIAVLKSPFDDIVISSLRPEQSVTTVDVLKKSARVIPVEKQNVGYVRFWNLMSMELTSVFGRLLEDELAECDAIIIDLRGRGGMVPVVLGLERSVNKLEIPVVAITDQLTRSAKEMLSFRLKKLPNVTVIGEKTAGAVTGATFSKLPSGNVLMYPAASADMLKRYLDDTILEGIGVEPDEEVVFFIPYCDGNDRLLTAALRRAVDLATKAR